MFRNLSVFRLSGRVLVAAALIAATLAVAPAIGAQDAVAQNDCSGAAVTVDLALGELPTEGDDVILGTCLLYTSPSPRDS